MSEPWRGCAAEAEALDTEYCWCDPPTPNVYAAQCVDCLQRALRRAYAAGMRRMGSAALDARPSDDVCRVIGEAALLARAIERGEGE